MSTVSKSAIISLSIADFANTDPFGKTNVLGMFADYLGYDPVLKQTTRFSLLAEVLLPVSLCPTEFDFELALTDASGNLFTANDGKAQKPAPLVQIRQRVKLEKPKQDIPSDQHLSLELPLRHTFVIDFPSGLPLNPDTVYCWRLQLDGDADNARLLPFAVA